MDIKTLKEITKLMRDNDLVEVEVESGDLKVKLKKAVASVAAMMPMQMMPAPVAHAPAAAPAPVVDEFAGCKQVISPIPGTVYLKPNPDAANFVSCTLCHCRCLRHESSSPDCVRQAAAGSRSLGMVGRGGRATAGRAGTGEQHPRAGGDERVVAAAGAVAADDRVLPVRIVGADGRSARTRARGCGGKTGIARAGGAAA